ncbi:TPA: hypothetical protein KDY48_004311 [Vibrio parahaemolyticus]|nr:hypothetical protein [Vibrio parahaemolyticus]HBC3383587.1 hypothetical protein [Vibrio parahaemolyticus]HBC3445577.1 hypothetical protein [Vibrio parahaemolyticus]HBC3845395.1 hypothetical protein [Vibrio parahaemolyticus]HBH7861974.1 hypothetical protein [Vibrio parahaemolyticus]
MMSHYCKTAIFISDEVDIHTLLTRFATECYGAREAIPIDSHQFNIDAGMNDVRAVVKRESTLITFCCRYQRDVRRTEEKVQSFIREHDLEIIEI